MGLPDAVRRTPLDEGAFAALVGDAHVVALGENNHHIAEFGAVRARLVRFLVGELGFSVVAMESGFPEGERVDAWLAGSGEDLDTVAAEGFTFRFGDAAETRDILRWLRKRNGGVRFAGLDVPGSGGSPLPALDRVRDYLAAWFPGDAGFATAAIEATAPYRAANNGTVLGRYATLDTATRDAATTALGRLVLRLDALAPAPDPREHRIVRHHALGALRLDEQVREFTVLTAPDPPPHAVSSRDVYQAETVRLLRALHGPEAKIVLLQHNGHLQREPLALLPGVTARCAGSYLAAELGADYRAIGLTAVTGTTTDGLLEDGHRHGIDVVARPLDPPAEDSLEHAVTPLTEPVLLDLRPARGTAGPASVRHAWTHSAVDVVAAFDGFVCLPTMRPSAFVTG